VADFQFSTGPVIVGTIVARGDSGSIGCRLVVHGVVNAETIPHEVSALSAIAFCTSKAA
jgi:hypothetical protein